MVDCKCHRRTFVAGGTAAAASLIGLPEAAAGPKLAAEPDSALARASLAHLVGHSGPVMVRHCRRTYQFGMALAAQAGAKPDAETLYIGCLLHDLGLEDTFSGPDDFETIGAREARRFLGDQRAHDIAERVGQAIELHTAVASAKDPRPEVAYLHMGALVDVAGARLDQIPPALVQRVVEEFPRQGTKALLAALLGRQIEEKPNSRIGRVSRQFNLLGRIAEAPFAS